jgi:transposase InsO family protein
MSVSERRVCRVLGQHRSTQRRIPTGREDEERLTADIIELARQYGRYGYRKIAELLRNAGWVVNDKRVERIWRREGAGHGDVDWREVSVLRSVISPGQRR